MRLDEHPKNERHRNVEESSPLEAFPGHGNALHDQAHDPDRVPSAPAGFDESYVSTFANQSSGEVLRDSIDKSLEQSVDQYEESISPGEAMTSDPGFERDLPPSLSDIARSGHQHKRRLWGLVLLVVSVLIIVGAIIGIRHWMEQQKSRNTMPAAITPTGDANSVAIGKASANLGVSAEKPSQSVFGTNSPEPPAGSGVGAGRPGPLSGPALYQQGGPGQPLALTTQTGFDASGRPIPTQPIVPPNRFDSPLGAQDGRGYSNTSPSAGVAGATNPSGASSGTASGAAGLFNPLQYLQQMGQGSSAPSTAPNSTAGAFSGSLSSAKTPLAKASLIGNRSLMLTKGALIPCVLDTAVVSSVSSMVRCHTPKDIFSEDGKVVLFEAGSQIKGEFSGAGMKTGSKRLYILWSRIDTPLGVKIDLESPGADQLGRGGLEGDIDKHWGERIGSAFLLSFVQDAIGYAATRGGNQMTPGFYQNTTNTGDQMATAVLKDTIAIPPTLSINQGELVNIFVARDLDFSDVYQLKVK